MATTTNYSWETPDDTDLVKDGAAAIRTLGSSIDTTTKALNPSTTLGDIEYRSSTANTNTRLGIGSTGQVLTVTGGVPAWAAVSGGLNLISRQTFSDVATTTTTFDGVFTSAYKTYLIAIENMSAATSGNDLFFQYRVGASTTSGATYYWNNFILLSNATTAIVGANTTSQIQLSRNVASASNAGSGEFFINKVGNASEKPKLWGFYAEDTSQEAVLVNGSQYTADTYTGFILSSSSSNISGTVAVYGLVAA